MFTAGHTRVDVVGISLWKILFSSFGFFFSFFFSFSPTLFFITRFHFLRQKLCLQCPVALKLSTFSETPRFSLLI